MGEAMTVEDRTLLACARGVTEKVPDDPVVRRPEPKMLCNLFSPAEKGLH
jgi:hypothetical protein